MTGVIERIRHPEIFIGLVAPIGTDISPAIEALREAFVRHSYQVSVIRVTDLFPRIKDAIPQLPGLDESDEFRRYETYIEFGDRLRELFDDDAILASLAVVKIAESRRHLMKQPVSQDTVCEKNVYIIRQFKRREETDRLRHVYGGLFFQVSVYTSRNARVTNLAQKISSSRYRGVSHLARSDAETLIQRDEDEIDDEHGQRVSDIFHDADVIFNRDVPDNSEKFQVERFVDLLFGANNLSPSKMEYGMYMAKSASLRSLDLSRQVGAAIFSTEGELLSMGSNEVPKAGGGSYWSDEICDARDHTRREDINQRRKREILSEIIDLLDPNANKDEIISSKRIQSSQFMDALEYSRVVHAEMNAICDSARNGVAIKKSILFCTTFPCHMCAKHIVSSGICKVIYLEPYPKSLATDLNGDSFAIEGFSRGEYENFKAVDCCHFFGISPRRYREFFERKKRKDKEGQFERWKSGFDQPIVDIYIPNYVTNEAFQYIHVKTSFDKLGFDGDQIVQDDVELPQATE